MTEAALRAFGADRLEAGPGEEMSLLCPLAKSWTPRKEKTLTSAEYPGTAVEWEGRVFEVRRAEPFPGGAIRYLLAPWAQGHAIRRMEHYDAASEDARAGEQEDRRGGVRKRRLAILFAPAAGLLPGAVQKDMESEFGAPAVAMTISSALPLFVIGFLGVFQQFIGGLGAGLGLPGWLTPPFPLALYLAIESALRLGSAIAMGEPMGSLPIAVAYAAWVEARSSSPQTAGAPAANEDPHADRDRYQMLEPLLSLLSPHEQRLLEASFRFEAIRWGRITAWILLAAAGLNAVASLGNLAGGAGGPVDFVWLLIGGFVAAEQMVRLRRLSAGEPAGSVLGALIRPLAKQLLATPRAFGSPERRG